MSYSRSGGAAGAIIVTLLGLSVIVICGALEVGLIRAIAA